MSKSTPGPWSCETVWPIPELRIHAQINGIPFALAEVFTMRGTGEKEANAHLISAAPDLLAALKSCVDALIVSARGERDRALAAIAKAEGKDPT